VVRVRDLIIYMLRQYGDMSYPGIARLIDRDHTTIIHSYQKIKKQAQANPELEAGLTEVIDKMKGIKARKLQIQLSLIPKHFLSDWASLSRLPVRREIPERSIKILELYREGLTYGNIGKVFNVTRERIRQVVNKTIEQIGINESIEKGIVMNSDVLAEEELKKRKLAQESKRIAPHPKNTAKEYRWSRFYMACRSCGTTAIPHVKKGLCEQCIGRYRAQRREEIIAEHNNKCDTCGRNRYEATASYGRDFYITKERRVLCQECFRLQSGKILGSYRNHAWSRHYERCLKCATVTVPHVKKGLCENCAGVMTLAMRERAIALNDSKCSHCSISRSEAKNKYKKDLFVVKTGQTLCRLCFQKYAKSGMRNAKQRKRLQAK
jgi:Bacterial dnaA protein helix-turn-helix/Sigma-70, region 4